MKHTVILSEYPAFRQNAQTQRTGRRRKRAASSTGTFLIRAGRNAGRRKYNPRLKLMYGKMFCYKGEVVEAVLKLQSLEQSPGFSGKTGLPANFSGLIV
jgi:hypothetical protein